MTTTGNRARCCMYGTTGDHAMVENVNLAAEYDLLSLNGSAGNLDG